MAEETELPDELVVILKRPVSYADQEWTELKLREPTAGEFRQIQRKDGTEASIELVRLVAAVPLGVVERIGVSDLKKATDYLLGFIKDGQETGARA